MNENKIIKHIRAERIDIVEPDGTLRMGLFNSENVPPAMMDGVDFLPGHRSGMGMSGILFYNTEGDECGGLIFGSEKGEDGTYKSNLSMTFDQYKQDQTVQIMMSEENGERQYGFRVFDRPDNNLRDFVELQKALSVAKDSEEKERLQAELTALSAGHEMRMHAGKLNDGSVGVNLYGKDGKPRIKVYVDADDNPCFEFLDADGNVIKKIDSNSI